MKAHYVRQRADKIGGKCVYANPTLLLTVDRGATCRTRDPANLYILQPKRNR